MPALWISQTTGRTRHGEPVSAFVRRLRSLNQEPQCRSPSRPRAWDVWQRPDTEDVMQTVDSTLYCEPTAVTADLTTLLASAELGDREAADALFTALYEELHR